LRRLHRWWTVASSSASRSDPPQRTFRHLAITRVILRARSAECRHPAHTRAPGSWRPLAEIPRDPRATRVRSPLSRACLLAWIF
jgi:hypothetical protein